MRRFVLCVAVALGLIAGGLLAEDKDSKATRSDKDSTAKKDKGGKGDLHKDKHARHAKITKVDKKKGTITVQMTGKDGKESERTFTLTSDVLMWDSRGNVAEMDVFRSGDLILVVEAEGKLKAVQKNDKGSTAKDGKTEASKDKKDKK